MSVTAISGASFFQPTITQGVQNRFQQIQTQFQQLGQDLQAGNLSQAQQDYATLSQELPSTQQQSGNGTLAQAFSALGQDLQAGNLSAAQQEFAAIQQRAQQQQQAGETHPHHHHRVYNAQDSASGQQNNPVAQAFSQLGQALQAGNLSAAQATYATIQQDWQQFLPTSTPSGAGSSSGATAGNLTSTVNVTV